MLNDILNLDQLQWLPNRSDFPPILLPCYRALPLPNYEWSVWSICNGRGMTTGNAYPSSHLVSSPFLGFAYAQSVETSLTVLAMPFLDFSLWLPSLLSRFCILQCLTKRVIIPYVRNSLFFKNYLPLNPEMSMQNVVKTVLVADLISPSNKSHQCTRFDGRSKNFCAWFF